MKPVEPLVPNVRCSYCADDIAQKNAKMPKVEFISMLNSWNLVFGNLIKTRDIAQNEDVKHHV